MSERTLDGRRILVVEDDYFLAEDMARALVECGAAVVGPVPDVATALRLAEATADLTGAVLDVNVQDEMVFPVADALLARGVPFVFATGYDAAIIPERFASVVRCEKPVRAEAIAETFDATVANAR